MAWDDTPPTPAELGSWDATPPTAKELGGHSTLQKIAQLSAMPRNGIRGIATGVESLLEGKGAQPSLADAAAATDPNYKAPQGSKLADLASNLIDPRMLGLMAATGGAGVLTQGAALGAGSNALNDLENKGTTSAGSVLGGAATGAATAGALKGAGKLVSAAPDALKDAAISLVRATGGVRPGAVQAYEEMPNAIKAALGTEESQRASTQALQQGIEDRLSQLRQNVQQAKGQLGITAPSEISDLPTLKSSAKDILDAPIPQDGAGQLDRIQALSSLKDQITAQQKNLFNNGNADVLQKSINPNAEAGELQALYGKINGQLKQIPAAKNLVQANEEFSPVKEAYDDVLQKQFGGPVGRAQNRVFTLSTADPASAPEAMAPDVQKAIDIAGGDVPALYQAAKTEAIKRAMSIPNSRILNNPIRTIPGMIARAGLPGTIDLASALANGGNVIAQPAGAALTSPATRLSLIQALLQAKKEK